MTDFSRRVHGLYFDKDYNCARTMLICLCESRGIGLAQQTLDAAIGMHGAGRFRAQCGLVEGTLMALGVCGTAQGLAPKEISALCFAFAGDFTRRFGSILCRDLRPGGFQPSDPPHACEPLTCAAVAFAAAFLEAKLPRR
ncbi:MAG: C-GCAxxG-C-C family (seleno)protein [Desulfovibrio sp.]|jgi:hypothetical protein